MKKLEDISKNHPFKVPEGYFDELPRMIQARIEKDSIVKESTPYFRYALQYALPVIVLAIVAIIYLVPQKTQDVDSLLASVSTDELVIYLEQSDLTTDELLANWVLDDESVKAIESEAYFNTLVDDNLNDIDLENL